jgi:hypothetical protein
MAHRMSPQHADSSDRANARFCEFGCGHERLSLGSVLCSDR